MAKIVFKCLQCGRCCKNLFRDVEGALVGLGLFPDERKLFPKKLVSPQTGVGWGLSGPKHILDYQLNVSACPHLSKDNSCGIYDKRPLACQGFPLIWTGPSGTTIADPSDCTFVEEIEKKMGSLTDMLPMTPKKFRGLKEWQAIWERSRLTINSFTHHLMDVQVLWGFDLRNKEWQILRARLRKLKGARYTWARYLLLNKASHDELSIDANVTIDPSTFPTT
jgi:Fe-S-cluster containining protein